MNRNHIRLLINFDDDGVDTSTGYVSATGGPEIKIDEELTEILRSTVNKPYPEVGDTIRLADSRWGDRTINDYTLAVWTNGDVELIVSRDVEEPVEIIIYLYELLKIVPNIGKFIIDCQFNHNERYNSALVIRNYPGRTYTEETIKFFEKHIWFLSGTPKYFNAGTYLNFESRQGGVFYVPDYNPFKQHPYPKLTTNFLK